MSFTSYGADTEIASSGDASLTEPMDASPRILSLDVLRGVAVLGGLFISILLFGGFGANRQNGVLVQSKGVDHMLFVIGSFLLDGKMRALISIVFGAGMVLYLFKGNQRSQLYNAGFFITRQLWLIAFGLINALLFLWSNDILFHLGIMGVLLFPFARLSARGLLIAAILTTLIYSGKIYWRYADDRKVYDKYLAVIAVEKRMAADSLKRSKQISTGNATKDSLYRKQKKDTLTKKQVNEKQAWDGLVKNTKYDPKKDDEKNKIMRSTSYGKIWDSQLGDTQWREAAWTYRFGIWSLSSMMLLGMALFRFGFFNSGLAAKRKNLLLAVTGITAGLLLGWFRLHHNHVVLQDYAKYIAGHPLPYDLFYPFEIAFMAFGYTSLILLLMNLAWLKRVWQGLAITGQMALTNYLLQSVICLFFFTGFGMGYFGRLQQWQLYAFACEVALINVAFSILWLHHFQYGPAEWLLRSLIYKKWLPNRIGKPDLSEPITII